jgi:hypothetical protein
MFYRDNPERVNPPEFIEFDGHIISQGQIMEILADPVILWEALGPDGIADPYPNGRGFYQQRQNAIHNDRVEEAIILAIASKNFQELGEIFFDQAVTYAQKMFERRA